MTDQPTPTPRTAAFFAARPLTLDGQTFFFCEQLERELAEARADAARLLSELADGHAKKSDALIAAVDDIERLTAERDDAISLGRHALFCVHHTDAERIANTVGGNCPICNKAQIQQLRAERDDANALARNYAERMKRSDAELAAAQQTVARLREATVARLREALRATHIATGVTVK